MLYIGLHLFIGMPNVNISFFVSFEYEIILLSYSQYGFVNCFWLYLNESLGKVSAITSGGPTDTKIYYQWGAHWYEILSCSIQQSSCYTCYTVLSTTAKRSTEPGYEILLPVEVQF